MGYYKYLNRTKWYYRLKEKKDMQGRIQKGMFSDHPRHTLTSALIVALSYNDTTTNKVFRLYTFFKSYLEYGMYQMKLPQNERCFYEIILGESTQKPHFDVDIANSPNTTNNTTNNTTTQTTDGEAVKDDLVASIVKTLKDRDIELNMSLDILIYTSHGPDKQSYHVIVNNHCHANNVESKAFYDAVMDHVNHNYAQWIDRAVYSPTQQFRIVGCQKIGSKRIKTFQKKWMYQGKEINYEYPEEPDSPEHEMVMQLEASVIGFTGNCRFLPPFEPRADQIKHYTESDDITTDDASNAIKLIGAAGNISPHDPRFPYQFTGINGPIVMLKRTKPSRCKICDRVHQHENPYLLVVGEEKSVFFFCRRAPEHKKLFLGKLNPIPEDQGMDGTDQNLGTTPGTTPTTQPISPEQIKTTNVKINWTRNVIDRVQRLARKGSSNDKKYISSNTQIDPNHKKQFIEMYINNKD